MLEILDFIFQSFWTFLGSFIILWLPFQFLQNVLRIITHARNVKIHGWPIKNETEEDDE